VLLLFVRRIFRRTDSEKRSASSTNCTAPKFRDGYSSESRSSSCGCRLKLLVAALVTRRASPSRKHSHRDVAEARSLRAFGARPLCLRKQARVAVRPDCSCIGFWHQLSSRAIRVLSWRRWSAGFLRVARTRQPKYGWPAIGVPRAHRPLRSSD